VPRSLPSETTSCVGLCVRRIIADNASLVSSMDQHVSSRATHRPRFRIVLALGLLASVAVASPARAESDAVLTIAAFSSAPEGAAPPPGWAPLTFKKIPTRTEYAVVKDGEVTVVRAESRAGASGLTRRVSVDLREYPLIEWRWKVSNVIAKGDVRTRAGDDYAARIYITFAYDPDKVSFSRKLRYKAGRLLFGDVPISAITYIWERAVPEGTIVDNAYTDVVKMIVVESGKGHVGRWMTEERNLDDDYRKAFSEDPPLVNGVAIMTDTDNTGETVTAYYGDIVFKKAR